MDSLFVGNTFTVPLSSLKKIFFDHIYLYIVHDYQTFILEQIVTNKLFYVLSHFYEKILNCN